MTIYYRLNSGEDGAVLSVFGEINESITSDAKSFEEAVLYLTTTAPEDLDVDRVSRLMSLRTAATAYLRRVSDRVTLKDDILYFDGDEINNSLTTTIIRLTQEDDSGDPTKLVKFLENLMNNPSEHSREQLYDWISPRNITITNDGHFLAYKGLNENFTSINQGQGIVNNVRYKNASLDNSPGNVIEFPRSEVEANSYVGCAVGLHAGTYEYASGFAQGKLVLVKINPRDVVSVPTDCDAQKLRVCRYEILEEVADKLQAVIWTETVDFVVEDVDDETTDIPDSDPYEDEEDDEDDYWDESEDEDEDDEYVDEDEDEDDDKYSRLRAFMTY